MYYRLTTPDDVLLIQANQYVNAPADLIIKSLSLPQMQSWTILNNLKRVAVILASTMYKDFYNVGIIVCKDITMSELKYVKRAVKEIIYFNNAGYVCSEGETHPVKDRFHRFMGFEIETDLGVFKKWKYKGLEV